MRITDGFSHLLRWEIGRRLLPNGPIPQDCITEKELLKWKRLEDPQLVCEEVHKLASQIAQRPGSTAQIPKALDVAFWDKLAKFGGEEAASAAGYLSFQLVLERHTTDGFYFRMRMAPPVLETSRRLWRLFSTERLLRVKVDQDLLYKLQEPIIHDAETGEIEYSSSKHKNLVTAFQRTLYKPVHILGK